jgi:hypothetical protein
MVVTYIYCNNPADHVRIQVRCRNFADAINRTGGAHRANLLDMDAFTQNTPHAKKVCGESDLLVIYRYLYDTILTAIQYWKARDKKVIVDLDQAVNYLTETSPAHSFWFEGQPMAGCGENSNPIDPAPIEQFKWGLALLDAATACSPRLADDWSRFTNTYTVLDYINTDQYPALNHSHNGEIRLGLGYHARAEGLAESGLLAAINSICHKNPQVKFVLCGTDMPDVDPRQIMMYSPQHFEDWVGILSTLDIGLMPTHGEYDLRLGFYDLLEFMVSKIPWIASAGSPLQSLSAYGLYAKNTSIAWETAILDMVEQIDFHRKKAHGIPFLFALSQNLGSNLNTVLNAYKAILHQ